ncbi:MAG TPA: hypothetical protein PK926_03505 [Spirochaetota bacterium]|nr:hypothetical protein [Spirochaetota bacterium]HPI89533.1 hypothetical protein [Spirochaetota bacterium]
MKAHIKIVVIMILAIIIFPSLELLSKQKVFEIINLDNISNYDVDRIAYQRIEKYVDPFKDNSVEALLIIKDKKTYLMMDGFDGMADIKRERFNKDIKNEYMSDEEFWVNKINGKPDFIKTVYRRSALMTNSNEEFVTTNFGSFYRTVRDNLLKRHVDKFRNLMRNRGESQLNVTRKLLSTHIYATEEERNKPKYSIVARAKATDETIYYCEDADGDGVTETFTVHAADGFDWGYKSGPNIIFIFNNQDKDVETIIGKLANESVYGNVEEEKNIIQGFPKERDINDLIEWLTPMDKFYYE